MNFLSVNVVDKISEEGENSSLRSGLSMLTSKDLAMELGVAESTIWSWVDRTGRYYVPDFPRPLKIGRNCTRWRAQDVASYLAKAAEVRHVE